MNIQTGVNPNVHLSRQRAASVLPSQLAQPANPGSGLPANGFLDTVTRGMVTAVYESGAVLQNDPTLAVRQFATTTSEWMNRGYAGTDQAAWLPFIGAGARTLILGADVLRAKRTFSTETSLLEKSLDVARVATDLAGVAGAVLRVVSSEHAALGTTLMGIAQGADLISHGARFGMHSAPRVRTWLKDHEDKKARERERERKAEALGLS